MRVFEVTWEGEENKCDQYPGWFILFDNEGKLNEVAACTCIGWLVLQMMHELFSLIWPGNYQLACKTK